MNQDEVCERLRTIGPHVRHRYSNGLHTFMVTDTTSGAPNSVACFAVRDEDLSSLALSDAMLAEGRNRYAAR